MKAMAKMILGKLLVVAMRILKLAARVQSMVTARTWRTQEGSCTTTLPPKVTALLSTVHTSTMQLFQTPLGQLQSIVGSTTATAALVPSCRTIRCVAVVGHWLCFAASRRYDQRVVWVLHCLVQRQVLVTSGWLWKKGGGKRLFGRRSWHKRWMVVEDAYLLYFVHEADDIEKVCSSCASILSSQRGADFLMFLCLSALCVGVCFGCGPGLR